MLAALVGFWIGTTLLGLNADGTYYTGGASLLDQIRPHSGRWVVEADTVIFTPDAFVPGRPIERFLIPQGTFRCAYSLESGKLTLSDCPYQGTYAHPEPRNPPPPP
jgi:hypothetical protein